MSDIPDLGRVARSKLALPPAEQISRHDEQIEDIYAILDKFAVAILSHDEQIKEIGTFIVNTIREANARRQPNSGPDAVETPTVEGDTEPGTGDAVSD